MGVTYKQGKIMKNIYKSFALLCMGLAATACIEENFENNGPKYDTTPGNEIVFSATAGIENGDKKTRTVYGDQDDPSAAKGWIEINWVDGDMIAIASPQSGGPKVGRYSVTGGTHQKNEGEDVTNPDYNKTHAAASLTRLGDSGLQWSEEDKYTFYAAYPSFDYDTDKSHGATAKLTEDGVLTGSMPIDQNYNLSGNSTDGWVAAPDMRYSFMTASMTDYDRTDEDAAINLEFKSMVTALQFDIKPSEINIPVAGSDDINSIEIISVSLQSNRSITGKFEYQIGNDTYTNTQGTRMASIHFDKDEHDPVILENSGESLNVTFFILPEEFDTDKETPDYLRLQVIFKLGNTQMSRIATINVASIEPKKKYIFKDVYLPPFVGEVPASSWWDALDPNTILPQVSIPVASNVFANTKYGVNEVAFQQHSETIETLWSMGVRGFEICCQTAAQGGTEAMYNDGTEHYYNNNATTYEAAASRSLKNCRVVAAQKFVGTSENMTFHKAFNLLCSLLKAEGAQNECLFVVCTYMAKNDGYCPYTYVSNLINYLDWYCDNNTLGITKDTFRLISGATTVGDLRGKIAIIVRPGDDERWANETAALTDPVAIFNIADQTKILDQSLTGRISSTIDSDWVNNIMIIEDWGAESYDVWDRRYGSSYARQAAFNQNLPSSRAVKKTYFEDYLWASTPEYATLGTTSYDSNKAANNDHTFPSVVPTSTGFNYEHKMSNGNIAYVQEWMRVVDEGGVGPIAILRDQTNLVIYQTNKRTVWAKWPSSLAEKKSAIKALFEKAVETRGQKLSNIYINVLTGYLADWSVSQKGLYPYKVDFSTSEGTVKPSGAGQGGNFAVLAEKLNKYTYDLLSTEVGTTGGLSKVGPWGLVMMDHIKAGESSADLVELIMMNNFKFPMTTINDETRTNYNATYSNGGEAISFK
jgi:hypothetical protein